MEQALNGDIILNYGDTISDINIDEFIDFHQRNHEKNVTISSYPICNTIWSYDYR